MAVGRYRITGITDVKILTDGGSGTVTETDLSFAKTVKSNTTIKEIEFEGDGTTFKVYKATGFDMDIEADTYDALLLKTVFNKTEQTGVSGVASRTYHGDTTETAGASCGIKIVCDAVNLTGNVSCTIHIVAPVGLLGAVNPPEMASMDKSSLKMKFTASKTSVDIAANALAGVPSGGAFWYLDRLS